MKAKFNTLFVWTLFSALAGLAPVGAAGLMDRPWQCHVIDGDSRGADGVRLADVNADGQLDITTGWEEGGVTRVYLHPDTQRVRKNWPALTVGKTPSVEDAVFCDLDGDGAVDVVTSCEGRTRCMFVHWAPKGWSHYLQPEAWKTDAIPATQGRTAWMFALPMQIDGRYGTDLVVGSKGADALVGWLQAPAHAHDMAQWRLHPLYEAGWIMSLVSQDLDGDGDLDIVVSDRKGETSGVLWLENPGSDAAEGNWTEHRIGVSGREVMFLDLADLDGDGRQDAVVAVKPDEIHWLRCPPVPTQPWSSLVIKVTHPVGVGTAKGVCVGDIDGDGKLDIVYSCEHATPPRRGVVWLGYHEIPWEGQWTAHDISGPEGIKFDRIELLDMDGDSDLDVLTTEERHQGRGIGVFWYENPLVMDTQLQP